MSLDVFTEKSNILIFVADFFEIILVLMYKYEMGYPSKKPSKPHSAKDTILYDFFFQTLKSLDSPIYLIFILFKC